MEGEHMKRKNSPPITAELASRIKYMRNSHGLYQHQIAAALGINQGRVSEVLTGKRHPGVPPLDQPFLPL
jgi:transcriptional regulator with XRE-family HTH domain